MLINNEKESAYFLCKSEFIFFVIVYYLEHSAHRNCIIEYNASENARNNIYLCPMKCIL